MKSYICCDLKNEKVKAELLPVPEVPDGLFKLHTLAAFIGCRGSGKTNACVLLAQRYIDEGVFNRIFIISPTYESNPQFEALKPDPNDVYMSIHGAIEDLTEILDKVKEDVDDHERREEYRAVYARWRQNAATMKDMNLLEANEFRKPPNIPKPCPLLIIDDMSHSPLYQPSQKNPFINLCLRHRHLHRVGITIFMMVQTLPLEFQNVYDKMFSNIFFGQLEICLNWKQCIMNLQIFVHLNNFYRYLKKQLLLLIHF